MCIWSKGYLIHINRSNAVKWWKFWCGCLLACCSCTTQLWANFCTGNKHQTSKCNYEWRKDFSSHDLLHLLIKLRILREVVVSVTRLGNFLKFLLTIFLVKVEQIFSNLWGYFKNVVFKVILLCLRLGQSYKFQSTERILL